MSPWAALRVSGAYWVAPVVFALGVWVAMSQAASSRTDYVVNNLAVTSYQIILTGPVVAAYVALRLPPFLVMLDRSRLTRSRAAVLATVWSGVLVGGPAAGLAAMFSVARAVPQDGAAWEVVGVTFLAGLACAAFGALVGATLPRVLAIPLVAAVTFAWIAFPGSRLQVLPRNLNSLFECCTDSQRPATAMVLGSSVLDLVVVLGCLAMVGTSFGERRSRLGRATALVLILATAAGLGTAAATAAPGRLQLNPAEPRTSPLTCTVEAGYRVCVWPEDRSRAGRLMGMLRDVDAGLSRAGLPRVAAVSEDPRGPDAIQATAASRVSTADLRFSLAEAYVWHSSTCGGQRRPNLPPEVLAVTALAGGVTPAELSAQGASEATQSAAQAVLREPPASVAAWFREHTCGSGTG